MDKRALSERDICTKLITPALRQAGWDEMLQIREEVSFVRGKLVSRGRAKRADYILYFKPNIPLALIEAKDNSHGVGDPRAGAPSNASMQFSEDDLRKWKDATIEIAARGHDKSAAYTNLIIIIAGYAGAFTLWNFTRRELSHRSVAAVAVLLSVSLSAFVAFEVYKMLYRNTGAMRQRAILTKVQPIPQMLTELAAFEAKENQAHLRLFVPLWNALFWIAVIPALGAGLLLFYSFFATLLGWPRWP